MKTLLAGLLLAFAPAAADDFLSSLGVTPQRFEKVKQGFYSPQAAPPPVASAARAAVLLETNFWRVFLNENRRRCSGTFISDQGHVLTAAHCVVQDLTRLRQTSIGWRVFLEHGADAVRYGTETTRERVGGSFFGSRAVIEAAGRGLALPNDLGQLEGDPARMARLRAVVLGDWAILRIDAAGPTACAAAAQAAPAAGEKLWLFGYAGEARRLDAPGAPGGRLVMTEGVVLRDLKKAAWYPGDERTAALYSAFYQPALDAGDLILSDADAHKGMSGGAAYDGAGRVAGVLSMGWTDSKFRYSADSAKVISVGKIRRALSAAGIDPSPMFRCPAPGRAAPRL